MDGHSLLKSLFVLAHCIGQLPANTILFLFFLPSTRFMRTKEEPSCDPSILKFVGQSFSLLSSHDLPRVRKVILHTTALSLSLYVMLCGIPGPLCHADSGPENPLAAEDSVFSCLKISSVICHFTNNVIFAVELCAALIPLNA